MKTVKINLYSFHELNEKAKEEAIFNHKCFLDSLPVDYENEAGELIEEYIEHEEEEVIENIEANEYIFFFDGSLTSCTTYTGKHEKAGITELKFKNQIYTL
jgi:allophanate hydrolase subunit 1